MFGPLVPLAALVAALVALIRDAVPKNRRGQPRIDGHAVLGLVAVASVLVVFWSHTRSGEPLAWSKLAVDAAVLFVLSAGGTRWAQRLRDRGVVPEGSSDDHTK